jgi:hypothetical protein
VARAKRTDRAEARRRYRSEAGIEDPEEMLDDAPAPSPSARPARSAASAAPTGRVGIGTAFRTAIHPVDVRSDLRSFPEILRSKALWIPIALTVGSAVVVYVLGTADVFSQILYTYFVQTPAIGGVFLAGFLATRSSWLIGVIVGIVSAVAFSLLIVSGRLGAGLQVTADQVQGAILYAFLLSPVMGALFAASAAWYRRFLQLSNPNRARRAAEQQRKSGGSGRSRGSQKAGARR